MSFLLQGNARSLSFHGEANAPSSPAALGKPRVRKPTQPPRASIPQPTTRMGDGHYGADAHFGSAPPPAAAPIRTPFPQRIPTPIPGLLAARSPYAQRPVTDDSISDDPTMALGRPDLDVMPGGRMPAKPLPAAGRSIPHFRGAPLPSAPPTVVVADTGSTRVSSKPGPAWLGWLVASVVLGFASYHFAPSLLAKVAPAAPMHSSVASHAR